MSRYDDTKLSFLELFETAVNESTEEVSSMLRNLDVLRMTRLCTIDKSEVYEPHHKLIRKLFFSNVYKHSDFKNILNSEPREIPKIGKPDKGVWYVHKQAHIPTYGELQELGFVLCKPDKKLFFCRVLYRKNDFCIKEINSIFVERQDDVSYKIISVEGDLSKMVTQLKKM